MLAVQPALKALPYVRLEVAAQGGGRAGLEWAMRRGNRAGPPAAALLS